MDEPKISRKEIDFLYEGLKVFYPSYFYEDAAERPVVLVYKGIKRSTFVKYVLEITDTEDAREAITVLLYWKGLSEQDLAETVPPEIREMVRILEESPGKDENSLAKEIEVLEKKVREKGGVPKPPKEEVVSPAPIKEEIIQKLEDVVPPLRVEVSPGTAKGITDFFIKAATFPVRTLINFGSYGFSRSNPSGASAVWLISQGISSTSLKRAIYAARAQGVYIDAKKIAALEKVIKEQQNVSFFSLLTRLNRESQAKFTQAEVAQIGEVLTPHQTVLYPSEDAYLVPSYTYTQGIFGGLAKGVVGQIAGGILSRVVAKAVTPLITGAAAAAAGQAAVPIPGLGILVGLAVGKVIDKLKDLWVWIKTHLREPEKLLPYGIAFLAGGLFFKIPLVWIPGAAITAGSLIAGGPGIIKTAAGSGARLLGDFATGVLAPALGVPVLITIIAVPAAIALILFIINSGAYMVPPARLGALPGVTGVTEFVVAGTCPIEESDSPCISRGSIGGLNPSKAHGDASYGRHCYGIPIEGMWLWYEKPENDPTFANCPGSKYACNGPTCPYYGFAADVKSLTNNEAKVSLPKLCVPNEKTVSCGDMTWKITRFFYNCNGNDLSTREACIARYPNEPSKLWGWATVFESDNNGHHFRLYVNHYDPSVSMGVGQVFSSGQVIGNITVDSPSHIHLELVVDGVPSRPDYMCSARTSC